MSAAKEIAALEAVGVAGPPVEPTDPASRAESFSSCCVNVGTPECKCSDLKTRTRLFRGSIEGRDVLVTIHDPEGYGEVAFRDGGRWGAPVELHEEA